MAYRVQPLPPLDEAALESNRVLKQVSGPSLSS